MLSIETPSDPSCPGEVSVLKSDERALDKLAFQEADLEGSGQTHPPQFSIRDYVFASRSKGIGTSWPFPQQILQLCLNHGVTDLLPPFEPPNLVRAQCCRKRVESEQLVESPEAEQISPELELLENKDVAPLDREPDSMKLESCLPSDQLIVGNPLSVEEKLKLDNGDIMDNELIPPEVDIVSTVTGHGQPERISGQISELPSAEHVTRNYFSEASSELEIDELPVLPEKLEISHEPLEKKCRLIVKLGTIQKTSEAEDIVSTSSTVSDAMASKVCPVCKTFTSTSNTTLNAHIDQCLCVESDTKQVMTKFPKLKVKPRKTRLMVDIYVTAPYCTLEDLDNRNGTNWATDLTLMAATNEVYTQLKKPKLLPVDAIDDGNEGAVYFDSSGTKLRILSKFSDVAHVLPRKDSKLRKYAKDIKVGNSSLISRRKFFKQKHLKYMKVNPPIKKLSSLNLFKGLIQAAPEGDRHVDAHQKEESLSELSNAGDQVKSSAPATLGQWACSKRSVFSKNLNKGVSKSLENTLVVDRNPLAESIQPNSGDSSFMRSHVLKLSRSSGDLASSRRIKSVYSLSNSIQATDNGNKSSSKPFHLNSRLTSKSTLANGLVLKLSRSSGNFVTSPRTRRKEIHMETSCKCDDFSGMTMKPSESCHPSLRVKKSSTLKKSVSLGRESISLEAIKGEVNKNVLISKKFRKHRSILGTGKQVELPVNVNGELNGSMKDFGFDSRTNKATTQSNSLEIVTRLRTGEINDQVSLRRTNISGSEKEREDIATMERQKNTLKGLHLGAECHDPDIEISDMQVEASVCVDTMTRTSMKKAVDDPVSSETVLSENLTPGSNASLDPWPSAGHGKSICGREAQVEPSAQILIDEQEMPCGDNKIAGEVESRVEEDLCMVRQREDQNNTASIRGSSPYLINYGDTGLEIPQENSAITLTRSTSNLDHDLAIDMEPFRSPVPTSSSLSPPSTEYPKFNDLKAESLVRTNAIQDKSRSSFSNNLALPSTASIRGTEGTKLDKRNREVNMKAPVKEPEKFLDGQPCCCPCIESLSRESLLSRRSSMAGMMLPSKGKQIKSNLYISPTVSSSGASPSLRTNDMTSPIMKPPTGSILSRPSSDSTVRLPTRNDFGSSSTSCRARTQVTANPILRLMGKDLVVNKEEAVPVLEILPSDSNNSPNVKHISLGFPPTIHFSYHHHQLPSGPAILSQAPSRANREIPPQSPGMRMGGFAGAPSQKSCQKRVNKKSVPSFRVPYPMGKVMVIDDTPELEAEPKGRLLSPALIFPPLIPGSKHTPQRPFPCFPLPSPYAPRESLRLFSPSLPDSRSKADDNNMKKGGTSEGLRPLLPSPLIFQTPSAGHLTPSLYYSGVLR